MKNNALIVLGSVILGSIGAGILSGYFGTSGSGKGFFTGGRKTKSNRRKSIKNHKKR